MRKILFVALLTLFTWGAFAQFTPLSMPISSLLNNEYNPCVSGNGRTMVLETIGKMEEATRWVISYQKGGAWTNPTDLTAVNFSNTTLKNTGVFLDYSGNLILFSSNRANGIGAGDIWFMTRNAAGAWSAPQNFGKPINSTAFEADPSLSPDGRLLYFTRYNDKKTADGKNCGKLYVSEKVGKDTWKEPVELPSPINSGCDCNLRVLSDARTITFASQRVGGKGGYDQYLSRLQEDGSWSAPQAMSFLNTDKDDRYISLPAGGGIVFYSALNKQTKDIVRAAVPAEFQPARVQLLSGVVRDENKNLLAGRVTLTDLKTGKLTISYTNADGSYMLSLVAGKQYDIAWQANENGYLFRSEVRKFDNLEKFEEKILDVVLEKAASGKRFALNLSFAEGSTELENSSQYEINRLTQLMKYNAGLKLSVNAYVLPPPPPPVADTLALDTLANDSTVVLQAAPVVPEEPKVPLEKLRAEALIAALEKKGVSVSRISVKTIEVAGDQYKLIKGRLEGEIVP